MNNDHNWRSAAECLNTDPEVMFPDPSDRKGNERARSICATCPVRKACLAAAMDEEGGKAKESRWGVRGGLTGGQRYYLRTRNRMPRANGEKPRAKQPSTRPLAPCGTGAAYDRHVRNHEPVDNACREAHNAERRAARARKKAAAGEPVAGPVVCGTRRGYRKHHSNGEPACDACRQANTDADNRLRRTGTTLAAA
ncbi:WhiB family transcriptional regulator [Streptomyces sp.]|uniref:WhiB family transcriptional regulator n=1 Tax=Streptomyces sp. TaxID=1931 RepID=UPI002F92FE91